MVAQSLTWLDMAIVFGPHIPLLIPLLLLSLVTNRWAHEAVGLRRLGLRETRAELSKPSTWYVLFSVVCQQVLTAAVFLGVNDNDVGVFELWVLTAVMVVVAILCIAVAVVPVQWLEDAGRMCCRCACTTRFSTGSRSGGRHQRQEKGAGGSSRNSRSSSSSTRGVEAGRPAGTQMVVTTNRASVSPLNTFLRMHILIYTKLLLALHIKCIQADMYFGKFSSIVSEWIYQMEYANISEGCAW